MSDLKKVAPRDVKLAERFLPYADQLPESARAVLFDIILTGNTNADNTRVRVDIRQAAADANGEPLHAKYGDGQLFSFYYALVLYLYHIEGKTGGQLWRKQAVEILNKIKQ